MHKTCALKTDCSHHASASVLCLCCIGVAHPFFFRMFAILWPHHESDMHALTPDQVQGQLQLADAQGKAILSPPPPLLAISTAEAMYGIPCAHLVLRYTALGCRDLATANLT